MRNLLLKTAAVIVIALLIFNSCAAVQQAGPASVSPAQSVATGGAAEAASASPAEDESGKTPYTLMVYMCGSDLESEGGLASADLSEMIKSGFDQKNMNVVVMTGGTTKWQTEGIPADTNAVWQLGADGITPLEDAGAKSMGDPATLTEFINYACDKFPSRHYGLILWDHGAGSVDGYGCDDRFNSDSLTLDELGKALGDSKAAIKKFSFIGFDACLMATIETAWTVRNYADVLIGSEELEPGDGWDYNALAAISKQPDITGADAGKLLVDGYIKYNQENSPDEQATLSVIDLAKVQTAVDKLNAFSKAAESTLQGGQYTPIAKSRSNTKAFGSMGQHGGEVDMIDIASMADQMKTLFPTESGELTKAISDAVIYSKNTDNITNANGLSVYFPFADKESTPDRVKTYKSIPFSPDYTQFVQDFAARLTGAAIADINVSDTKPQELSNGDYQIALTQEEIDNTSDAYFNVWTSSGEGNYYIELAQYSGVEVDENGKITTEFDGNWTTLNGQVACLFEEEVASDYTLYSIPAYLNGKDVDLLAVYDEANPDGKIIGARPIMDEETGMPSKNVMDIKDGDKIKLLYYAEQFTDANGNYDETQDAYIWYEGDEFTVKGGLKLKYEPVDPGEYLYGFELVDYQQNSHYTDMISVKY